MAESYVTSAKIDGNKHIVLSIDVDAFTPGQYVEVSGCAAQNSYEAQSDGGFASFSEIQEIKNPDSAGTVNLTIKARPVREFQQGRDVTVAVRVSKVWITVLSENTPLASGMQPRAAEPGRTWGQVKEVGGPDEYSSNATSGNQAAAGGSPGPQAG